MYINAGGSGDGGSSAGNTKIYGTSSFTVNTKSSTTATGFDKTLFCVRNSGNVGIGTIDPQTLLDVRGRIYIKGNTTTGAPALSNFGGNGNRIILWSGEGGYPYALEIDGGTLWYSVPNGAIHAFISMVVKL